MGLRETRAAAALRELVQVAAAAMVAASEIPDKQLAMFTVLAEAEDSGIDEVSGGVLTVNTGLTATQSTCIFRSS